MSVTQTTSAITLKGSAKLVTEYLNFGINSILYQRGIYPAENFQQEEHFGLTMLVSTEEHIQNFLQSVLGQMKEWILSQKVQKISMVITNVATKETLEKWDFKLQYETDCKLDVNEDSLMGNKDLKVVQNEIRDVLRQICSTVSFLPLLDCLCAFDLLIYTKPDCEIPDQWDVSAPCFIANSQDLQLKSFSTSLHKMDTVVSYKGCDQL